MPAGTAREECRAGARRPSGPGAERPRCREPTACVLHARPTAPGFSHHPWAAQSRSDGDVHAQCRHADADFARQAPGRRTARGSRGLSAACGVGSWGGGGGSGVEPGQGQPQLDRACWGADGRDASLRSACRRRLASACVCESDCHLGCGCHGDGHPGVLIAGQSPGPSFDPGTAPPGAPTVRDGVQLPRARVPATHRLSPAASGPATVRL